MKTVWAIWNGKQGECGHSEDLFDREKPDAKFRKLTDKIKQNSQGAKFPISVKLQIEDEDGDYSLWKKIRLSQDGSWSN